MKVAHAIEFLNVHAAEGRLDAHLAHAYAHCHDKRRAGQRLALKTYYTWLERARAGDLAPRVKGQDLSLPPWTPLLLAHYRRPQKPTLREAHAAALAEWQGEPFSYDQAWRLTRKIETYAPEILYRGRNQGAGLKALLPYVKRGTDDLWSNDVWTGDGHALKGKIAHPDHGRPFRPEVTLIVDVASRCVMGWSVSFSENTIAVCDALRHAVSRHGLPLIYYSDNGAGQTARAMDAPVGGMLARLGIRHEVGIPGNPQGRGLVERLWQTLTIPLARKLPTFHGAGADRDYLRRTSGEIEKDLRRYGKSAHLPSLGAFMAALEAVVEHYNQHHRHRALNGQTPAAAYAARLREEDRVTLSAEELLHLFRPHVERTAQRGTVSLWNNTYANRALMALDGQKVLVGYDLHDAGSVVVRRLNGEFVCTAEFNGNEKRYFATSLTDELRIQRVERRVKKLEKEAELARAELPGAEPIEGELIDAREVIGPIEPPRKEELRSARDVLAEMDAECPPPKAEKVKEGTWDEMKALLYAQPAPTEEVAAR